MTRFKVLSLPSDQTDTVPKSVLRYLWNITVLKAGLGLACEDDVREWFVNNPVVLNEFSAVNRQFEELVNNLQQQCIGRLRELNPPRVNGVVEFTDNGRLLNFDFVNDHEMMITPTDSISVKKIKRERQ